MKLQAWRAKITDSLNTTMLGVVAVIMVALAYMAWVQYQRYTFEHQPLRQVVDDIKGSTLSQYTYLKINPNALSLGQGGIVPYNVPGWKYNVFAEDTASAFFSVANGADDHKIAAAISSIASRLKRSGFKHVGNPPVKVVTMRANGDSGYYERKDAVCLLGTFAITLDCTAKGSLTAVARDVQPFAEAYTNYVAAHYNEPRAPGINMLGSLNPKNNLYSMPFFGEPTIRPGSIKAYKYARVGVGDSAKYPTAGEPVALYFYSNAQGTDWLYLPNSDGESVSCHDNLPSDAAKALADVCNPKP